MLILTQLEQRYEKSPATITVVEKETELPVSWEDFKTLDLQGENHKEALEAYYRHKDHSALRYLSKPNHWMAANASYTAGHDYSTFGDYKDLIVLLWFAAKDEQMKPT